MTTWMIWLLEQETRHLLHHDPPPTRTHSHTPCTYDIFICRSDAELIRQLFNLQFLQQEEK